MVTSSGARTGSVWTAVGEQHFRVPQAGESRIRFTNNHLPYALTWYGLALAAFGVFVAFALKRLRGDDLTEPGAAS